MRTISNKFEELIKKYPESVVDLALKKLSKTELDKLKKVTVNSKEKYEALESFEYFLKKYFPHYFTIEFGIQQRELLSDVETFKEKKNRKPIKLLRALSRGFGKSTILSLCAVLWLILRREWDFVIMISSTLEAAKDFLRKIIEEVEDNALLREDFSELSPAIDAKSQTVSWKDTDIVFQGGQRIIAKGFLNSIRGKRNKQHRPSALIFDDPDEEADVASETTMIRKVRWFDRAALKLGSFWGIDVLFAYTTISPNCMGEVVYNDSEKYSKKDGWNKKKYKALEKDKNGNEYSTWPEGAPLELLLREREEDPVTFARERNNENLAEINQKFKGFVQTYEFPLSTNSYKGWYLALGVDISQGKNENSDLSAIVGAALSPEGKIYEIYSDICRRTPDQIIEDFISALLAFPWNISGFGLTGSEEYFLLPVRDRIAKYNKENSRKILIPITSLPNTGDKIARDTTALQPIIKTGTLLIRSDSKELIKALDEFPYYYKDGVDALEYAVRLIRQGRATTRPLEKVLEESNKKGQSLKDLKREQYKRLGLNPDEFGY